MESLFSLRKTFTLLNAPAESPEARDLFAWSHIDSLDKLIFFGPEAFLKQPIDSCDLIHFSANSWSIFAWIELGKAINASSGTINFFIKNPFVIE